MASEEGLQLYEKVLSCLGGDCTLKELLEYMGALESVQLATQVPVADNEDDVNLRTGTAGVSALAARADHNHPIRRLANPGNPVVTAGGTATIGAVANYPFQSTEETIEFEQRIQVTQPAGNNWGYLRVPNIAGYQRPRISELNSYRYSINPVQNDAGTPGESPRGRHMSQEIAHWSFTRLLYLAYFYRDNAASYYVTAAFSYKKA